MKKVFNIIVAFIAACFFPILIFDETLSFSNSPFSLVFFLLLVLLFYQKEKGAYDTRGKVLAYIFGTILTLFVFLGHSLETIGGVKWSVSCLITVILYAYVLGSLVLVFWGYLEKAEIALSKNAETTKLNRIISGLFQHQWIIPLALVLLWLPCFIAAFPGTFQYDATTEFEQINSGFRGDFPLLHSFLITHILQFFYNVFGSYNAGIACFVICQMILAALMYMNLFHTLYKKNVNVGVLFALLLYCGLFPLIQLLVTSSVRDALFGILLTYTVFLFYLAASDRVAFYTTVKYPVLLGVVLALTFLARNNNAGTVAFFVIAFIAAIVFLRNRKISIRGSLIFGVMAVFGYILMLNALVALCQPMIEQSKNGALTVLAQPPARSYFYENERWTDEERAEFATFYDLDGLHYDPENSDFTIVHLHIDGRMKEFLKFYVKIGMKDPACYLDSYLNNTRGVWDPTMVLDGYNRVNAPSYANYEKSYFYFGDEIEAPGVRMHLAPKLEKYYKTIGLMVSFEKVPIVSMLFSVGFQFWILLNCFFYALYRKAKTLYPTVVILIVYAVGFALLAALILPRYFCALFFVLPLIAAFTLQPGRLSEINE